MLYNTSTYYTQSFRSTDTVEIEPIAESYLINDNSLMRATNVLDVTRGGE